MKNLLLFVVKCFVFLLVVCSRCASASASASDDKLLAKEFIGLYFDMLESQDIEKIEGFFVDEFNDDMKFVFKKKCGITCLLGLSKRWEDDYAKYLFSSINARRVFIVVDYKITKENNNSVVLELSERSCDGQRSKEVLEYVQSGSTWKIRSVSFGSLPIEVDPLEKVKISEACQRRDTGSEFKGAK